jgi:hypothetical protein
MPDVRPAQNGEMVFDAQLPSANGDYTITATVSPSAGDPVTDSIVVSVRTTGCTLTVLPQPLGVGCDLGASADQDPNMPGMQTTLTAQTSCPDVSVTVNSLPPVSVTAADGVATAQVTLRDGENTITVSASDGVGEPAVTGPYPLTVRTNGPQIEATALNENRTNTMLLADGDTEGGLVFWTIRGTANGLAAGQSLQVNLEPALDNAPAEVRIDENGQFRLELAVARGAYYGGGLTFTGSDICSEEGSSPTYAIRLDAVVPVLGITNPSDSSLLVFEQDVDPARAGAQIPVTIDLVDSRSAAVDYPITVECAPVVGNGIFVDRARGPGDALNRSDLLDEDETNDTITVTFQQSERGEFICRAVILEGSNPVVPSEVVWRTFFDRPSFTVFTPARAPTCVSTETVEISGVGMDLDTNSPSFTASLALAGSENRTDYVLEPRGSERYAIELNSQALADGVYDVTVAGQVLDQVPVIVDPSAFQIIVDRTPPTVAITTPGAAGAFSDADPATPGTQSIIVMDVCGAPGQSVTVETIPALPGSPFLAAIPADNECAQIQLPAVTVPLGDVQITASVTDTCGAQASATVTAAIPPGAREAQISAPESGFINNSMDTDNARAGCQFDIEALGQGLAEGAEFFVCTDVAQTAPIGQCNGRSSALSGACEVVGSTANGARIRCPVSLQDGAHNVTFVGIFGDSIESAPVSFTVDCSAPSVATMVVVQDANTDGCVNAQERQNQGAAGTPARMTIRVTTEGLEDGQVVRVLTEDSNVQGSVAVNANQGDISIELPEGARTLRVSGADAAGNGLPTEGADLVTIPVRIDTTPPTPALTNVSEAACLNANSDQNDLNAGLQYAIQIATGRGRDVDVTAQLVIDGAQPLSLLGATDILDFPAQTMAEGEHSITATVTDTCGNVGSVNGFAQVGGQDDWSQPNAITVQVDTIAPRLSIDGLTPDTVLNGADDADENSANGFQVDVLALVDAAGSLEIGRTIALTINGAPAVTVPAPISVTEAGGTQIPVRITLSPGQQAMQLEATDVCGNTGQSVALGFSLDIPGCGSSITSFADNPTILNAEAGVRNGNELTISVGGSVDLLDANCAGAPIALLIDGAEVAATQVPAGGQITFENVILTEGQRSATFRVGPVAGNTLDSANQALFVDLSSPSVAVNQPAVNSAILTDANAGQAGQQALVQVTVSEVLVVTGRTATLSVDGIQIGASQAIANDNPVQVTFADVTLAAGSRDLQLCVSDGAENVGCVAWTVNADPAAPAAVGNLTAEITNRRNSTVTLEFTAPGDDGDGGGIVTQYAVRRADDPILDETAWQNAASTELIALAAVLPGAAESITISGVGPGPLLADGLQQNVIHNLSIRAMDDAGRMGPLVQTVVDLTMTTNVVDIPATIGAYDDSSFFNQGSMILGVGDIDNDGFDDALVVGAQGGGSTANLVFGALEGQDPAVVALQVPQNISPTFYGLGGASLGDVNGDGINDYAVIGVQNGFVGLAIGLYFGCNACERNELATPDSLIFANSGRLLSVVANAGNFNQRAGDAASFNDIFLGGTISAPANPTTAFVVAGRVNWPDLDAPIILDDDPAINSEGVTVLNVPDGKAGYAGAGVGDLNVDGADEIVFSAGTPSVVYRFNGGFDLPDSITYAPNNPGTVIVAHVCSIDPDGFGEHILGGGSNLDGNAGNRPNYVISDGINRRVMVFDETDQIVDCFGRSRSLFGNVVDMAGDIDGDGFLDLIVSHSGEQSDAFVFYNDGFGQFGDGALEAPRGAHIILQELNLPKLGVAGLGDMNGDGLADIGALVKQPGAGNLELVIYY